MLVAAEQLCSCETTRRPARLLQPVLRRLICPSFWVPVPDDKKPWPVNLHIKETGGVLRPGGRLLWCTCSWFRIGQPLAVSAAVAQCWGGAKCWTSSPQCCICCCSTSHHLIVALLHAYLWPNTGIAVQADRLLKTASTKQQQQQDEQSLDITVASPQVLLQLLQHVLYYAVNGRISELYTGLVPPPAPAPATAAAAAGLGQQHGRPQLTAVVHGSSINGASSPVTKLADALLQLQQSFLGLFPPGQQLSTAEIQQLKVGVAEELSGAAETSDSALYVQQQQHQGRNQQPGTGSAPAAALAAAEKLRRVLQLVQHFLMPPAGAAGNSAATSDSEGDSSSESSSSESEPPDEEQQQQLQQQQQQQQSRGRMAATVTVSKQQLWAAVSELCQSTGFSIAGLASLELQLQAQFGVQRFAQLGSGADSLLQLLQQQPALLALLQGGSGVGVSAAAADVGVPVGLAAVLQVVAQAKACCGEMEEQGALLRTCRPS